MKLLLVTVSIIAVFTADGRDFGDEPEEQVTTDKAQLFPGGIEGQGGTQQSLNGPDGHNPALNDHQMKENDFLVAGEIQDENYTNIDQQEEEGQIERILPRGSCKARQSCVVLRGVCITNATLCSGRLVAKGCIPSGSNCTCCVPESLLTKLHNIEMELQSMKDNITHELLNQETKLDSLIEHQAEACYSPGFSCASGEGTCRPDSCNSTTEDQNGTCGGVGCKCCTTKICYSPGSSCSSGQGTCRPSSCNSTTEDQSGTCGGASCKCCKTKPCYNPGSSCASGQGTCRVNSCLSTEDQNGTCGGASCKCCKPKICHSPGSSCASGNGTCRANSCNSNEEQSGTCGGTNCKCCKTKICYSPGSSCSSGQGTCRPNSCNSTTEDQSGTCGGASCNCCKTKPCYNPGSSCASGQGTCRVNSCLSTEDQTGTCGGASCKCCKPKICHSPGSSCASGSGTCRANSCNSNEEQSGTCGGTNCKCCKAKPCYNPGSSCASGQGTCRVNSCLSTEDQTGTCGGASCKCCKPKTCHSPGSSCASGDGTCRANSCNYNEEQSGTCGGTNCKCCTELLGCLVSQGEFQIGKQCFKMITSLKNWTSARSYCQGIGLDLAQPEHPSLVHQYIKQKGWTSHRTWIGAQGTGSCYSWFNGTCIPSSMWGRGPDGDQSGSYAVDIYIEGTSDKPLDAHQTSSTYYSLCEKKISCLVSQGEFLIGKQCFKMITSLKNWTSARSYCQGIGLDLAQPEHPSLVHQYIKQKGWMTSRTWIGARGTGSCYRWLNGTCIPKTSSLWGWGPNGDEGTTWAVDIHDSNTPEKPLDADSMTSFRYVLCERK